MGIGRWLCTLEARIPWQAEWVLGWTMTLFGVGLMAVSVLRMACGDW